MKKNQIKTLFLDIGEVLLSNGWDREARKKAIEKFGLDAGEVSDRHGIFFDTYESGKITLQEYVNDVVFYEPRNFSSEEFIDFIFRQSKAKKGVIEYFTSIKKKYKLLIVAVNNEGREINEYRIKQFRLDELFDSFISSCYVHLRKPDKDIFTLACDLSFTKPEEALFIDDRSIHVQTARSLNIHAIHFTGLPAAKKQMQQYGFTI